ncbi:hypothetical protein BGZ82_006623 [Podila clonocystis]|nr:hypothetical protein BGZ82_006623 [Podila clonocystis]
MMFLALRAMPQRTAARQELIMAAVELDKKFSAEKGLPRVFTGKTPMNSASACLTNNGDKYFIPFKPEGSRSTHFRLAYQPGNFDTALQDYNSWMEKLVSQDWPMCFGVPKDGIKLEQNHMDVLYEEEPRSPTGTKRRFGRELEEEDKDSSLKKAKAEEEEEHEDEDPPQQQDELRFFDKLEKMGIHSAPSTPCTTVPPVLYTNEAPVFESKHMVHNYRLDELDLSRVPSSLSDIVRVDTSTIPNAGNGLFAKVDLPASTPLGFYFGVPMTENEFDSLKDGVGMASQYSIMYRRTVLDATDEVGMPYSDPIGPLYCPFHFMNEDPNGNMSFITGSALNQVICTTNREIKAGEELLVFYGKEADRHWALQTATPAETDKDNSARSKSRTSSPTRQDSNRPRRETVFKPARYTR